ncbi:hypothetical protein ACLOJK_022651 [Asimina triloba]
MVLLSSVSSTAIIDYPSCQVPDLKDRLLPVWILLHADGSTSDLIAEKEEVPACDCYYRSVVVVAAAVVRDEERVAVCWCCWISPSTVEIGCSRDKSRHPASSPMDWTVSIRRERHCRWGDWDRTVVTIILAGIDLELGRCRRSSPSAVDEDDGAPYSCFGEGAILNNSVYGP